MKKVVIIVVIFLIFGIVYKAILLNKYHVDECEFNNDNIFNETITVHHNENIDNLFKYKDIYLMDDFSEYINPNHEDLYVIRDDHGDALDAIMFNKIEQYYLLLHDGSLSMDEETEDKLFTKDDRDKFLRDNNIKNDIDLYNYIKKNYYLKSGIFDSIKTLKENYMINSFVEVASIFTSEGINAPLSLIDGDLKGYIINISERSKEIHLMYNDEQYMITLVGDYFASNEHVKMILESIKFA